MSAKPPPRRTYVRCPECVRHFISHKVAVNWDWECNLCGTALEWTTKSAAGKSV